jgi:quinol monooxygenase YgiN
MAQIAVIAKITAQPGQRDEVVEVLRDVVSATDREPGTLLYAMNVDKADEDVIWFYELYTDDAALAAHGGGEAMKAAGGRLRDKTAGRPELHVLEMVQAKGLPG